MHAVVCVRLSLGRDRHKSQSDPVHCVCMNQDSLESAKIAVVHLLKPKSDEKVEFECLFKFNGDGKCYALIVDNSELTNWVVYVKEIHPSDKVVDIRHQYSGTWTHYHLRVVLNKI